ncbi:MAG TPA: UDP-N-acetylmuramoyl-L-alanine--D-glutamate ligase, partial [Candidatus Paceibacterota bacterium]|nr:UDP-N-acetylmuramoyl-L-alanine--D-glutamate ligase [Candidatus Paceibacterota bacterium]
MIQIKEFIKNKKVLVVGLGILGGGISTCLWLLKHKAKLTITDLKSKKDLGKSLKKLKKYSSSIKLVLGKHNKNDFKNNDIIVINQGVPIKNNPYLKIANQANKLIENE